MKWLGLEVITYTCSEHYRTTSLQASLSTKYYALLCKAIQIQCKYVPIEKEKTCKLELLN